MPTRVIEDAKRYWWVLTLFGSLVGVLGFQVLMPTARLTRLELHDRESDSTFREHVRDEQRAIEAVRTRVDRLLDGQCVLIDEPMARVAFGCATR